MGFGGVTAIVFNTFQSRLGEWTRGQMGTIVATKTVVQCVCVLQLGNPQ